jgi:hypothetical protein
MTSVSGYLRQNVLGLVAIFLALTGGAYAVTTKTVFNQDLGNSSVDSRVLANGAVTGPKIHSASVGPKKLKLDSLVDVLQTRVNSTCPDGQAMQGVLSNGNPICGQLNPGTITGVTTSGGLTGGGSSGTVDIGIDPTAIQSRVAGNCGVGQTIRSVAQDGTVTCQAVGTGTVTSVGGGFGLTGGTITTSGNLAVNPVTVQSRVLGTCGANTAVASITQGGGVGCSASFADVTEHSGRVTIAPGGAAQTLINFGGMILQATCPAGEALVQIGNNAGGAHFLDYQTRSTSAGMIGATVTSGTFATIMNTAAGGGFASDLGQFNVITDTFNQIDGSFYGWDSTQGGGSCQFDASALTY